MPSGYDMEAVELLNVFWSYKHLKTKDLISTELFMHNEVTCETRESVEVRDMLTKLHKQKGHIASPR